MILINIKIFKYILINGSYNVFKTIQVRENSSQVSRHLKIEEHSKKDEKLQNSPMRGCQMRPCVLGLCNSFLRIAPRALHFCRGQKSQFVCFLSWIGQKSQKILS